MKKLILFLLLCVCSSWANAQQHVGTFDCGCQVTNSAFPNGEVLAFIRSDVNQHVDSWLDSQGMGRYVTICGGGNCATYRYIPNGTYAQTSFRSAGGTGGGEGSGQGGGSGAGGSSPPNPGGTGGGAGGGGIVIIGPPQDAP